MQEAGGAQKIKDRVAEVYQAESRKVFATLVRLLGDFDLAEEALHEAFSAAVAQWGEKGVPANPAAWLVSAGRFRAIDAIRRRARFDRSLVEVSMRLTPDSALTVPGESELLEDDRLRLIFTCCHPALQSSTQVALTLREICGLTTEEIASAFLVPVATVAQRIVRGKAKIRAAGIPYQVPERPDLPERLESVLAVIYLVFNEGYSASAGDSVTRADLTGEAIRVARLVAELLPDPEVFGLLALMLFHDARRESRMSASGDLVLLEDQVRTSWNQAQIAEARALLGRALSSGEAGVYTIQAGIAGKHSEAPSASETDWAGIVGWYDLLLQASPSPIVELNRAVAVAMRDGPRAGLLLIDAILQRGDLGDYHLAHAARADLLRRSGNTGSAKEAYREALRLVRQEPERRFLERRIAELGD